MMMNMSMFGMPQTGMAGPQMATNGQTPQGMPQPQMAPMMNGAPPPSNGAGGGGLPAGMTPQMAMGLMQYMQHMQGGQGQMSGAGRFMRGANMAQGLGQYMVPRAPQQTPGQYAPPMLAAPRARPAEPAPNMPSQSYMGGGDRGQWGNNGLERDVGVYYSGGEAKRNPWG